MDKKKKEAESIAFRLALSLRSSIITKQSNHYPLSMPHYNGKNPTVVSLLERNKAWAQQMEQNAPGLFSKLSLGQTPHTLFISCSDSRVCPSLTIGAMPGHLFVTRNIANVVVYSDISMMSVLEYAVDHLRVENIVICGHYGCGGILAARGLDEKRLGLIDTWLLHIADVLAEKQDLIDSIPDPSKRLDKCVEINTLTSIKNLARTSIVRKAWERGQKLEIHGMIYDLETGLLKDLGATVSSKEDKVVFK